MGRRILYLAIFLKASIASGQETEKHYPGFFRNAYIGAGAGYIHYLFSQLQLKQGYSAEQVKLPPAAIRVVLYGRTFNEYLSAQITYLRPVVYIKYVNINGDGKEYEVGMNHAGLTLVSQLPVTQTISIYGEGGLGIVTRGGFQKNDTILLADANYASVQLGGGIKYRLNKKWEMEAGVLWTPENKSAEQPATSFFAAKFNYHIAAGKKLSEPISKNLFPENLVQAGYSTNAIGYGTNHLFSKTIPVFWGGSVQLQQGVHIQYLRNIYHSGRVFSFDIGAGLGWWQTGLEQQEFVTASLFPLFRFTALRTKNLDLYFNYSLAGPAFISKTFLDGKNTGRRFTFQDYMGMGIFSGRDKKLNTEFRIAHFSNGNLFPFNEGIKVPLSLSLGYSFRD